MSKRPLVVAVLETMWDNRILPDSERRALPFFRINEKNHSGRRLYKLVNDRAELLVTNACRELVSSAKKHGTPNPEWLGKNLAELQQKFGIDLLLVCGRVAFETYEKCGFQAHAMIAMPHPAARAYWTTATIAETQLQIAERLPKQAANDEQELIEIPSFLRRNHD